MTERRLQYKYAQIDLNDNMCVAVLTSTICYDDYPEYVPIDSLNDDYLFKYYINGAWYEDAEGTIPWSPAE